MHRFNHKASRRKLIYNLDLLTFWSALVLHQQTAPLKLYIFNYIYSHVVEYIQNIVEYIQCSQNIFIKYMI